MIHKKFNISELESSLSEDNTRKQTNEQLLISASFSFIAQPLVGKLNLPKMQCSIV